MFQVHRLLRCYLNRILFLNNSNFSEASMSTSPPKTQHQVALVACGVFNPITYMHLRMMECARDHLVQNVTNLSVIGGYLSPVSDGYGKAGLVKATHRKQMIELALNSVTEQWIKLLPWECDQPAWTPTLQVLKQTQKLISEQENCQCQTMLVCGSDFLHSFGTKGLWLEEDVIDIVQNHGLVVLGRPNFNAIEFIKKNDLIYSLRENIYFVQELVTNDLSSTKVRFGIRSRRSVKYLIPDPLIGYIAQNNLYEKEEGESELAPYTHNKERMNK